MADERPCCVWCKATMTTSSRRLRSRKPGATRLCIKCTLWALAGQTPPYVPPRREMMPVPPPRPQTGQSMGAW